MIVSVPTVEGGVWLALLDFIWTLSYWMFVGRQRKSEYCITVPGL